MSIKKRSEKLQLKAKEMGLSLSKTQALELVAAEMGFNNRNVALEKENSIAYSLICANQHLSKIPQLKKMKIDIEDFDLNDQLALMKMDNLQWKICEKHKPFINFYLETPVYSIYLGGIHSKPTNKKIRSIDELNTDDHSALITGLLIYPTNHKNLKFLNKDSLLKMQSFLKDKLNKEYSVEQYTNLKDSFLDLSNYKNKKLYNFITREAKKQGYDVIVDSILENLDISPEKRTEFFNHVIKYQKDNLWIRGECPMCGGNCGENIYFENYDEKWFTCQEMHDDFTGDEVTKKTYYFSMRKEE